MRILFRFLPLFIALLEVVVFYLQIEMPLRYPWIVFIGVIALPVAALAMSWKRLALRDALEKMIPSFVFLATLAFALLLTEGVLAIWTAIVLAALVSYISLELLFLMVYQPSRYPVNGLTRLNIAYVPPAIWYAAATSSGLLVFLHLDRVWHVILMGAVSMILFWTTGHVSSTPEEKRVWSMIGGFAGIQVGLLGLLLPVSMSVQGSLATLLLGMTLRARRYKYHPKPSRRQMWIEGGAVFLVFVTLLATAKWL